MTDDERLAYVRRIREELAESLLSWYDHHQRELPWRQSPINPYHILLSEVMAQQTVLATVVRYFRQFIQRWPTIEDLANAHLEEVIEAWSGLGYYRRAHNLHKSAKILAAYKANGQGWPSHYEEWRQLPGLGDYSAAMIMAIVTNHHAPVLDGNIKRIITRLFKIELPIAKIQNQLKSIAEGLTPAFRRGDYAQGLMDIAARYCRPRQPDCDACPLNPYCLAKGEPANQLPQKLEKKARPIRWGDAVALISRPMEAQGLRKIYLIRRNKDSLLAGTLALPSTPWEEGKAIAEDRPFLDRLHQIDIPINSQTLVRYQAGIIKHVFTHFTLFLRVWVINIPVNHSMKLTEVAGQFYPESDVAKLGLSSLMRKAILLAFAHEIK